MCVFLILHFRDSENLFCLIYIILTTRKFSKKKQELTHKKFDLCITHVTDVGLFEREIKDSKPKVTVFTPQPLQAVQVLISHMASCWVGRWYWAGSREVGKNLFGLYLRNSKI